MTSLSDKFRKERPLKGTRETALIAAEETLAMLPGGGKQHGLVLVERVNEAFCHMGELIRECALSGAVKRYSNAMRPSGFASKMAQAADPLFIDPQQLLHATKLS